MKIKKGINRKILLYVLITSFVVYTIAIGIISYNQRNAELESAQKYINEYADKYAGHFELILNTDLETVKTLSEAFVDISDLSYKEQCRIYDKMLGETLERNPEFISIWASYELAFFDTTWTKPYGYAWSIFYRNNEEIMYQVDTLNTDGEDVTSKYFSLKTNVREKLDDPYFYTYGDNQKSVLETSLSSPILRNNRFAGVVGVDIKLERFQEIISSMKLYDKSYAFLVANNGKMIAHPDNNLLNEPVGVVFPAESNNLNIVERIHNAETFSFTTYQEQTGNVFVSFSPITVGSAIETWSVAVVVPVENIMEKVYSNFIISILIGLGGLLILGIVISFISRRITRPLLQISNVLERLERGISDKTKKLTIETQDEIGKMADSVNQIIQGLNSMANFASQVGEGNLNAEFHRLSNEDILGNSLIEMRNRLRNAKEEDEKRKKEDEKLSWATQGIAKFAEMLRYNNDNLEELSYNIISNLVKYLDTNQGGLFLVNNDDEDHIFIELTAAYAYNRRKYIQKRLEIGETLVGQCVLEKKTTYLKNVPDGYVYITSGLGRSNPKRVLIVPLIFNEQVFGVIELASFNNFETYQIEFVEKVGQSIASTISSVKINIKTAQLLEESKRKSEQMAQQEEEMRQNMEEMKATQDEAGRREEDLKNKLKLSKEEAEEWKNKYQQLINEIKPEDEEDKNNNEIQKNN